MKALFRNVSYVYVTGISRFVLTLLANLQEFIIYALSKS